MKTIVWDVDDVLNSLMREWFSQAWVKEHPECTLDYAKLTENPPHRALGVSREEYLASIDVFRKSDVGAHLTPNAEILDWFLRHGDRYRHIALTARPMETAPEIASWVMRHFGVWMRCFGIVPSRIDEGTPAYDRGKGDFLHWLGKGDLLVDDGEENLEQAARCGLRTITWPQPWNRSKLDVQATLIELTKAMENSD